MGAQSERETSVTVAASGSCLSGAAIARESGGLVVATLESAAQSGARAVCPPTRSRACAGTNLSLSASTGTAVGITVGGVSAGTVFRRARHKSGRMAVVIMLAFVACCTPHYVQSLFETIGSASASASTTSNTSNTSLDQNASGASANEAPTDSSGDEFTDLLEFLALANGCATGALSNIFMYSTDIVHPFLHFFLTGGCAVWPTQLSTASSSFSAYREGLF